MKVSKLQDVCCQRRLSDYNGDVVMEIPSQKERFKMRACLSRWMTRYLPVLLLVPMVTGCDENSTDGTLNIIYAIGDVVLAILDTIFAYA